VVGAVAVSPDGRSVCFPIRRRSRSTLHCATAEGTSPRAIAESLDVRGAASWSPDGKWIAIAAKEGEGVRVFKIPIDGGPATRLVDSMSFSLFGLPMGDSSCTPARREREVCRSRR
jgi:Tol biopolymer transport system component